MQTHQPDKPIYGPRPNGCSCTWAFSDSKRKMYLKFFNRLCLEPGHYGRNGQPVQPPVSSPVLAVVLGAQAS